MRVDLPRSRFVAGIGELPTPVGLVDTVPAALAVVGFQLSHDALPASSSYDTYGYKQNAHQQSLQQITLNA
jgi:hypothetical protein